MDQEEDTLEIELGDDEIKAVKGKTTKKGFPKQIELLKEVLGK